MHSINRWIGTPKILVLALALSSVTSAQALILFNKDNSANLSDPGGSVPWSAVGKVTNNSSSSITGSAVLLNSDGWVLTANHVTVDANNNFISFDGVNTYEIDLTTVAQVAANVDLKVMKLKTAPSIAPVNLLTTATEGFGNSTTLVGWGKGRGSAAVGNQTVDWGADLTAAKRWGTNKLYDNLTITYPSYSYAGLRTILGGSDNSTFDPQGLEDEAALTLYDSGSSMFQEVGGTWYLVGVGTAVQTDGQSYFSDDSLVSPANNPGHGNYFARISSYDTQILGLIPEPTTSSLFLAGGLWIWLSGLRRSRAKS